MGHVMRTKGGRGILRAAPLPTIIQKATEQKIHRRIEMGRTQASIARELHLPKATVQRAAERWHDWKCGRRPSPYACETATPQSVAAYTPSQEKIAEECEKIRAGWTPAEERSRRVVKGNEFLDITTIVFAPRGRHVQRREVGKR